MSQSKNSSLQRLCWNINICSASNESRRPILQNPKIHHYIHKNISLGPVLSQMNALLVLRFIYIEPTLILFVHTVQKVFSSDPSLSVGYKLPECETAHARNKYEDFEGT